jgi:hypothetical protein
VSTGVLVYEPATRISLDDLEDELARARPICLYPEVARYKGRGDVADASSFTCQAKGGGRSS